MKIVILISALVFNFSLVAQKDYHTDKITTANNIVAVEEVEEPVLDVMLDTVEVTAYSTVALAGNLR